MVARQQWVTYSLVQFNRNSQIFVYSLDSRNGPQSPTISSTISIRPSMRRQVSLLCLEPEFQRADGLLRRQPCHLRTQQVMVVQLKTARSRRSPTPTTKPAKTTEPFRIDTDGLQTRPTRFLSLRATSSSCKPARERSSGASVPKFTEDEYEEIFKPGGETKWELHMFDMDRRRRLSSATRSVNSGSPRTANS